MKKSILITLLVFLVSVPMFSINDSMHVQEVVNLAVQVANATDTQIVKGLDNGITGTILSLLVASIIRLIEKKRTIKRVREQEAQKNIFRK